MTSEAVRLQLQVPCVRAKLAAARLRYAARASRGPRILRALLQSDGGCGWRLEVARSAAAMQQLLSPKLDALPDPLRSGGMVEWERLWSGHRGAWKQLIRRFLKVASEQPARFSVCADALWGSCEAHESDGEYLCVECGLCFPTTRSLAGHRIHKHQARAVVRLFCTGSTCPACGAEHHSRLRALKHMQRAGPCRQAWESGMIPQCDPAAVEAADLADRHRRRTARAHGTLVSEGPPFVPGPG